MCNEHRRLVALDRIPEDWSQTRLPLRFPEGLPNLAPLESIRITDPTAIIRASRDEEGAAGLDAQGRPASPRAAELILRRWSWPGPRGAPVFNFRSEGREFGTGRCLIVADGFYEYTSRQTDAEGGPKKRGKKDRWLFTRPGEDWFCIAGIWRDSPVGEACTMLTCEPGPDVAPYHDRQIVVLDRADWARWLDPNVPAKALLKPNPAGTFEVTPANRDA